MNSIIRAVAGGVCVGGGIAVGAYSGGWFLILAVLLAAMGVGLIAVALARPGTAAADGELVPVTVDLIDRSAPDLAINSTLIAGEARPHGDAPFRFHTRTNLSRGHIAGIVADGRGQLPSGALGEPGSAPTTEHRTLRAHAPAALTAVAAMWATMLLPPSDIWDLNPLARSVSSAEVPSVSAGDPDARPLWQWYDEALEHLRAEAPESLDALLSLDIRDTGVDVEVYLGGDRIRAYEGDVDGWETSEQSTNSRSRDTFTIDDLQGFSAQDFLTGAAAQLPPDHRVASQLEIARNDEDIFGAERPVLAKGTFGNASNVYVKGTTDGTIAPWWPVDDLAAGLHQVEAALTARGIPADAPDIKDIDLSTGSDGDFSVDFYRGDMYYRTRGKAGGFASPDDPIGEGKYIARFRFSDVSPDVLAAARDDAMRRYDVDPVDRGKAHVTIGEWGSGGAREDEVVIEVNFHDAHGGTAIYALSGEYLAG